MADSLQTALFRAVADFSSIVSESKKSKTALKDVDDAAQSAFGAKFASSLKDRGQQMQDFGKKTSIGVTLPLVALGAAAVKTFVSFDSAITSAGLKAGATADQMEQMKEAALEWGAKSIFSANETAVALDELAASGFNATDAIAALPGVVAAAQAANEELGLTAQIVGQSMKAFNLEAAEAGRVADIMSAAANNGAIDMQGLGEAMAHAGQLGATANQDLEDVVAAVGRLVDLGVPAASAGAAVRSGIASLQAPTKKAAKVINELGLEVRDAEGNMLPLPELAGRLASTLDESNPKFVAWAESVGMSGQEAKDWALNAMFGVEGGKAFGLMIGDTAPLIINAATETEKLAQLQKGLAQVMGEEGAQAWIDARTEAGQFTATAEDVITAQAGLIRGSEGVAEANVKAFSETTGAKLQELQGGLETAAILLVEKMVPALEKFAEKGIAALGWLAEFSEAHPQITSYVLLFLALAAAMGPLVFLLGSVVRGIAGVASMISGTIGGAQKFVGFIKDVSGGKGKAGSALDTIRLKMMYAKDAIVSGVKATSDWVRTSAAYAKDSGSAALQTLKTRMSQAVTSIKDGVRATADWARTSAAYAKDKGSAALVSLKARLAQVATATKTAATATASWIKTQARAAAASARTTAAMIAQRAALIAKAAVTKVAMIAQAAYNAVMAMNPIMLAVIAIAALVAALVLAYNKVDWFRAAIDWLWAAVKVGFQGIATAAMWLWNNGIKPAFDGIATLIGIWWNYWIMPIFNLLWAYITNVLAPVFMWLWNNVIAPAFNGIGTVVSWVWTNIISPAFEALKSGLSTLAAAFTTAKDGIATAWDGVKSAVKAPIRFVIQTVLNDGLIGGINWLLDKLGVGGTIGDIPLPAGFATGGEIRGPGSGTSDSILARLSNGEFVMKAKAVARYGTAFMTAINEGRLRPEAMGALPAFKDGGGVGITDILTMSPARWALGELGLDPIKWIKDKIESLRSMGSGWGKNFVKGAMNKVGDGAVSFITKAAETGYNLWEDLTPAGNLVKGAKNLYDALFDEGGVLQPGLTLANNQSGKPEAILTHDQWARLLGNAQEQRAFMDRMDKVVAQYGAGQAGVVNNDNRQYTWNVYNPTVEKTSASTLRTLTRTAHGG